MPVGNTPLTLDNSWKAVTVENIADRNGPCLKRIRVKGGWLYITEAPHATFAGSVASAPVFVRADML
jgi:hypothetical protein